MRIIETEEKTIYEYKDGTVVEIPKEKHDCFCFCKDCVILNIKF